MKKLGHLIFALFALLITCAHAATFQDPLELAESVPKQTIYGSSDVRRTQQVWLDMLNNAKQSINIGGFYFFSHPHDAMAPIVKAIEHAASRGVKVRILVTSLLAKESKPTLRKLGKNKNIKTRIIQMRKLTKGILHAKYIVVDDENSFVGSPNFDWRALDQNHEIGIRIRNKRLATTIMTAFNLDWQLANTTNPNDIKKLRQKITHKNPVTETQPIHLTYNKETLTIHPAFSPEALLPNGFDEEEKQLIQLIHQAKHNIIIQVMTYSPRHATKKAYWATLDTALRDAATRGINVKMILANWVGRKPMIYFVKSLSLLPHLSIKISTLPPYQGKFIPFSRVEHCKYMVVDNNKTWIGTGNWQWG